MSGVEGAMEWLLNHPSDTDIDEPLESPVENETESSKTATRSHNSKSHRRREFVPNKKVSKLSHTFGDSYTQPKNAQIATSLLTSCNNLLQQADIRMRSHGLRQLVDDKFVASCQQNCCKSANNKCANDKLQQA